MRSTSKIWYNESSDKSVIQRKAVKAIVPSKGADVILFPKTIEFYQKELTRLLEEERFAEAARLLTFLLRCRSDDEQYKEEWQSLLGWLQTTFPELETIGDESDQAGETWGNGLGQADPEDEPDNENELFKRHIRAKAAKDVHYTDKLLESLSEPASAADTQMNALAQLAVLDKESVGQPLRQWLESSRLHPLVQFRALQALRSVGEKGPISLRKLGQHMTLQIEDTPLHFGQFAPSAIQVAARCAKLLDDRETGAAELAEATWRDFLAFVYGTTVYGELTSLQETEANAWAAALCSIVRELLSGRQEDDSGKRRQDATSGFDTATYQRALQVIRLFATVSTPGEL